MDEYINPVASCPKLEERILFLEEENASLKSRLAMEHSDRLVQDAKTARSQGDLTLIATGHLIEAIRSLNPRLDLMELIEKFHIRFGLEYDSGPRFLPQNLSKFRLMFLHEELKEYRDAVEEKDLEGQLDALIDLVYVALGTAYLHGFDFNEGFKRVHDCNMKKIRALSGSESKRGSKFDVIKPPNWKPPYLKDLI